MKSHNCAREGKGVEDSNRKGVEGEGVGKRLRLRLALMQNRNVVNFISLNFALALNIRTHTPTHIEYNALICRGGVDWLPTWHCHSGMTFWQRRVHQDCQMSCNEISFSACLTRTHSLSLFLSLTHLYTHSFTHSAWLCVCCVALASCTYNK